MPRRREKVCFFICAPPPGMLKSGRALPRAVAPADGNGDDVPGGNRRFRASPDGYRRCRASPDSNRGALPRLTAITVPCLA
ncbi:MULTISPECIES: hypothetical protein [Paenibacillus]|uniref:hypothetical protein n=1 Tax=Paenibacillus TaxID=44249 RepID=UPI00110F7C4F|nr:hypothetical protein [Paenibacillus lactis]